MIVCKEAQPRHSVPGASRGHRELTLSGDLTDAGGSAATAHPLSSALTAALAAAFLPEGYPQSVTPDYLYYQRWDTVQGACSYVRGMLSSQALLAGVGVGSAAATPAAAALQFFLRDLAGMLGGIAFTAAQGSSFDAHAKQWRLAADVANDVGLTLELAAPLFPAAFLALACAGAACRAITGVAGGATRTALTQHFALCGNAADIAAKEGSQETAVTLVGMAAGLVLTRAAADSLATAWVAFALLSLLHVWANVRALRSLRMTSLNRPRLDLLLWDFLTNTGGNGSEGGRRGAGHRKDSATAGVASPSEVAARESLLPPPLARALGALRLRPREPSLILAPPLAQLGRAARRRLAQALADQPRDGSSSDEGRIVVAVAPESCAVVAVLGESCTAAEDAVLAYCLARMTAWREQSAAGGVLRRACLQRCAPPPSDAAAALGDPQAWADSGGFSAFLAALRGAGWSLARPVLLQGTSRLTWGAALASKQD